MELFVAIEAHVEDPEEHMERVRLRQLARGEAARVVGYEPGGRGYRSKLLSMGLTKGTIIVVRNVAPFGDPIHVAVRDFELSLRGDEADALWLVRVSAEETQTEPGGAAHGGSRHTAPDVEPCCGRGPHPGFGRRGHPGRGRGFGRGGGWWKRRRLFAAPPTPDDPPAKDE